MRNAREVEETFLLSGTEKIVAMAARRGWKGEGSSRVAPHTNL